MQQIINPITAKELNDNNMPEVKNLYEKSSLNLLIVGGLLFLLINVNVQEVYMIIGKPEYSVGIYVVLVISVSEMIKLSLGTNGAILTNSKYYKAMFYYAIGMAMSVIVLNKILIEIMGIQGAALATFIVVLVFSFVKILYLLLKMKMQPFTGKTIKLLGLILILFLIFNYIPVQINPFLSIFVKSAVLSLIFVFFVIKLKLSTDMNQLFARFFKV